MSFEKKLEALLMHMDQKAISTFLYDNRADFFNTPKIKTYYDQIKHMPIKDDEARLTLAWLALLSGDNMMLYTQSNLINSDHLDKLSKSFFLQLKALSGIFGDTDMRLTFINEALNMLDKDDKPAFYLANGYLTHGQILVGMHNLREGANAYYRAYELFLSEQHLFPASVALTNALLNWFRLGEFKKVLSIGEKALMLSSSFESESRAYWDVVSLPLGMCYFEQNKLSLAIEQLKKAYKSINEMNLIHMHGYVEIYLIKAYHLSEQKNDLEKIINKAKELFSTMHYPMMSLIICYGHLLLHQKLSKAEIEKLETIYHQSTYKQPLLIEMMAFLSFQDLTQEFSLDIFEEHIKQSRYEGDVVNLFIYLLLFAEYYYRSKNIKSATLILEEAMELHHQYQLETAFHLYPYNMWPLINKLNPKIKPLNQKEELLTSKEKDILILISQGKTNEEIGDVLFISVGTVKWHINHILSKLYAKNRMQAVEVAKTKHII